MKINDTSAQNGFKTGNTYGGGRPRGRPNIRSEENRLAWESRGYENPILFLGSVMSDPEQDIETRVAAGNLAAPYMHPKIGAIIPPPDPTFMEIKLKNPSPTCVEQCVENINLLTQAKASGEVSIEHADSLIADQKVILYAMLDQQKQLHAEGGSPEHTIRIEGGLPALPGTNITMPERDEVPEASAMNGHAMDPAEPVVPDPDVQPPNQEV